MMHAQSSAPASPPQQQTAKLQFYIRLTPPRTTFAEDMTTHESEIMQQHAAYWADIYKSGAVLIVGPVNDPKGIFGMAVIETSSAIEAQRLADNDPSVKAGVNKVEVIPMHVFLRKAN